MFDWIGDAITTTGNIIDDLVYSNEEQANNEANVTISNNEAAIAAANASNQQSSTDLTWLWITISVLSAATLLYIFFRKRNKKSK